MLQGRHVIEPLAYFTAYLQTGYYLYFNRKRVDTPNAFVAADGIEYASGTKIPLWLFGFLY
jgi:energy-converting hydrogenase Eha subunit G